MFAMTRELPPEQRPRNLSSARRVPPSKAGRIVMSAVPVRGADRDVDAATDQDPATPVSAGARQIDSSVTTKSIGENESSGPGEAALDSIRSEAVPKADGVIRLPFVSLADLCCSAPTEPEWLWRGYLAPGVVTLLAGRPKAGKSTLTFALLAALSRGSEFLGQPVRSAHVLLLSEEPAVTIREKATRFGIVESRLIETLPRDAARGLHWEKVIDEAGKHCRAQGAEILVVDTLNSWAGLAYDDENKAGAMMAAVEPLLAAADNGLAILALVHQRKSPGSHGEAIRGSNALPGSVEIVAELERVSMPDTARALYADSRFQTATPSKQLIELTGDGYILRAPAEVRNDQDRDKILVALKASREPLTADQLADATGLRKPHVYELLHDWSDVRCCGGSGHRGSPFLYQVAANSHLTGEALPQ